MSKKKDSKKITFNILPNDERVIVRLVQTTSEMSPVLMPGQLKAGEALHTGEIVEPGNTKFKKGQVVYYSEYSAAKVTNVGSVLRGEQTLGAIMSSSSKDTHVVAADDIMAYEKEVFDFKQEEPSKSPPPPPSVEPETKIFTKGDAEVTQKVSKDGVSQMTQRK